jgi:hypothetical protein
VTFLATPAESRKAWASKASFCLSFLLDLIFRELVDARIETPPVYIYRNSFILVKKFLIGIGLG